MARLAGTYNFVLRCSSYFRSATELQPSLWYNVDIRKFCFSSGRAKKYRPRRALLYIPGNDEKKILKIPSLNVDCAVMDCEDGVALNKKSEARSVICRMLNEQDFGHRTEYSVRINAIESGLAEEDLKEIFQAKKCPDAIVIPKVENVDHVDWVADRLKQFGRVNRSDGTVNLVMMTEGARALLDLDKVCHRAKEKLESTPFHLDALIFGSDDFCADIGATRTMNSEELMYARQHFVVVAKAHRLQAVDMVYINYKDLEGLRIQAVKGSQMGFTGKQVIHPSQIPIVQNAFLPSTEKIEWASELIAAFEVHQKSGKGAFTFRGSMIDMPSVLQAKNIIQLATDLKN